MTGEELKEKLELAEIVVTNLKAELADVLAREQGFSIGDVVEDCNHELWRIKSFDVDKCIDLQAYGVPLDENGKATHFSQISKIIMYKLKKVEVVK